jgi:hypothetical protein
MLETYFELPEQEETMNKKNDNPSFKDTAFLKKRPHMDEKELEKNIKSMTDEALLRVFLDMLREDQNRASYLFQFIQEVVNSAAALGSEGYQPIATLTLYARESDGVMEFKFRPARTGSEDVYRNLKLKRFFELVNDAWVAYGNEVFGNINEETRVDMSAVDAWTRAVEDQEEEDPG